MWQNEYSSRYKERCGNSDPDNPPDLTNDDKFVYCLQRKFEMNMDKILYIIKNNIFDGFQPPNMRPKIYFCYDDDKASYWRKDQWDFYKANRKKSKMAFNVRAAFAYVKHTIIPMINMEQYYGVTSIEVPSAEGDDIIMGLVTKMKHPNNVIIGSDHDYVQCLHNCRMFDMVGKELTMERISKKITNGEVLTPKKYLLIKLLMGDTSDGIPGVKKGVGPKTAYKWANDPTILREHLQDIDIYENFKRNRSMIDCELVPKQLQQEIIDAYKATKNRT